MLTLTMGRDVRPGHVLATVRPGGFRVAALTRRLTRATVAAADDGATIVLPDAAPVLIANFPHENTRNVLTAGRTYD